MISLVRQHRQRLSRASLALFAVLWLGMIIAPCAMAHVAETPDDPHAHQDCPHCPPKPCHQRYEPVDCDAPTPVDRLRSLDSQQFLLLLPPSMVVAIEDPPSVAPAELAPVFAARDGPRIHLLFQHFKE